MANFEFAYSLLIQAEYGGQPQYFLHKNKYEKELTCGGIFRKYNPESLDWIFVSNLTSMCGFDISRVNEIEVEVDDIKEQMEFMSEQAKIEAKQRIDELEFQRKTYKTKLKRASKMIYADDVIRGQVGQYFRKNYWDISRLDEVQNQNKANEIFLMSVVAGVKVGVKLAQELVQVKADGIVGEITLKALNQYDDTMFDRQYDQFEKRHFDTIIERNPKLAVNKNGWYNRSDLA